MTAQPLPFAPLHISTDAFPAHRRLAMWREIYGRTIAKFDIEPINDMPFRAGVTLRLLPGYLGILREADKVSGPELQRMVVSHIHDLLASALGATQDAAIVAEQRGIRSARLRAIMLNIVENLDKRQLSVTNVASRFGV